MLDFDIAKRIDRAPACTLFAQPGFRPKAHGARVLQRGRARVVDIRNPFEQKEIARFIPEVTKHTTQSCIDIDGLRECDRAIRANNVNLDDRGFIYALDRASTGLHILELAGQARAIAGL